MTTTKYAAPRADGKGGATAPTLRRMGHKHSVDKVLAAAARVVAEDGLHQLSFGRVAKAAGTSDRVVVYYFPTKDDLAGAVLAHLGGRLQAALADAVPEEVADHRALVAAAWPVLSRPVHAADFRVYVEALGLAAAGAAPYAALAPVLLEGWLGWLGGRLAVPAARRRDEALAAVTLLDGLLLVSVVGGTAAADRAAALLTRP